MKPQLIIFFICFFAVIVHPAYSQNFTWVPTQGPYATEIHTFKNAFGNLYTGTNSGLYFATNGGKSWINVPSVTGSIYDIDVQGANIFCGGSAGVTVSTDSGKTWVLQNTGFPLLPLVYALKNVNDTLYACLGDNGFYYSVDSAKHWSLPSNDAKGKSVYTMISTGRSLIFAEGVGILRSTDNGFSWSEPDSTIASQTVHTFILKGNTIFAGTDAGIFTSTDDGVSWNAYGSGFQTDDAIESIVIASDNQTMFAGTKSLTISSGVYRSKDGGSTWQQMNNGLLDHSVNSVFISGTEIFCGTQLAISKSSDNGDSWQTSSNGLPTPIITSLEPVYDVMFAATSGSFIFSTSNVGDYWLQHTDGLTRKNINTLYFDITTVFAGTDASLKQGGLHRSTDNGITWTQSNSGMPLESTSSITKYGSSIYSCGDSGIFQSSDEGISWKTNTHPFSIVRSLYSDNDSLYAVADSQVWAYSNSTSWNSVEFPKKLNINAITRKTKYLYAATDSGIYRDSASVWKLITGDTLDVLSLYNNFVIVAAGTKTGIYISSNDGNSWQYQQSAGPIKVNTINATGTFLYAGTDSGIIKASIVGYAVKQSPEVNPLSLGVTNPSNNQAIIRYASVQRGMKSIVCYDMLGRKISQIFQGESDSGEYDIEWNTSLIPNGTYLLRLVSGSEQTSAMINIVH